MNTNQINQSYDLSDDENLFQMFEKCIKKFLGNILTTETIVCIVP